MNPLVTAAPLENRVRCRPAFPGQARATVSVVIPCFNYARFLPQAVRSALTQVGVDVQVIVVDDASSDDSRGVAAELALEDPRVTVLSHDDNRGPVQTFNDGLAQAVGEFLVRLDADDVLTPGSLRRSVDLAQAFPQVGLVYGHPIHFRDDRLPKARERVRTWTVWPGPQWLAARCRSGLNVITSPEVLMRRSVVDLVGGQRDLAHTHDMEMWFRIAAFADVAHLEGPDQAWHREHPGSLSARQVDSVVDLLGRRDAFETLFAGPAGAVKGAGGMREQARQALAREALDSACHAFDRARADPDTVESLTQFARQTFPAADRLPEWRSLRRRVALGQTRVSRRPWYAGRAVLRRLALEQEYRTWTTWGVYRRD